MTNPGMTNPYAWLGAFTRFEGTFVVSRRRVRWCLTRASSLWPRRRTRRAERELRRVLAELDRVARGVLIALTDEGRRDDKLAIAALLVVVRMKTFAPPWRNSREW